MLELIEGGRKDPQGADVPAYLKPEPPCLSNIFVVDGRLPIIPFVQALAGAGYSVINLYDGRLVITRAPEDFRRTIE